MNADLTGIIRGLIQYNLLKPGTNKLFLSYYRRKIYADVLPDGAMLYDGRRYLNPSTLALAMKRALNPSTPIRSDPGWISLFSTETGQCLKDIREMWISRTTPGTLPAAPVQPPRSRHIEPVQPMRETCSICLKDRGIESYCVKCEACGKLHHKSCAKHTPNTTYYCESCIDHHCSLVLNLLQDLRQVAVQYGPTEKEPADDKIDGSNAAADGQPTLAAAPAILGLSVDVADQAVDSEAAETSAVVAPAEPEHPVIPTDDPPATAPTLLAQIDGMIRVLGSQDERLDILLHSTGEVLVHLSSLDIAKVVNSIDRELTAVVQNCARENDPNDDHFTPGIDGLVQVLNLRHGILSGRYHFKRTVAALTTLSEKRLRGCDAKEARTEEAWQKELRLYEEWVAKMAAAKGDVLVVEHELAQTNALIDNAVRHRKALRALSLAKRFIPAYRVCTADLAGSSDHLLVTIVADKLKGLTKSLKKWEHMDEHFHEMKSVLLERRASLNKRAAADDHLLELPALKLAKVQVQLKCPPLAKLIDRQVADLDTNLGNIQRHKDEAMATLKTIEGALKAHSNVQAPTPEWEALLETMQHMIVRCQPAPTVVETDDPEDTTATDDVKHVAEVAFEATEVVAAEVVAMDEALAAEGESSVAVSEPPAVVDEAPVSRPAAAVKEELLPPPASPIDTSDNMIVIDDSD
ncbi:hypothetical protein ACHHYP_16630 [Achlya hypogyna]|uniref:RAMA domain-containing protein n=1 Tax=Achlya hypogyna TaxID=1202772 RepID=A0A1V9Y6B4_ACHHY|nr:hypothetical protein ACHHYP_16630 [Achlya hypogyna]